MAISLVSEKSEVVIFPELLNFMFFQYQSAVLSV